MKPRLINLEAAREAIKPYLQQYLQEHGYDTSKNFRCINPAHNDGDPSMTCKKYPNEAFCFGCGMSVDVFKAANILEDKPDKGSEFVEENLLYLAKKYNVQVKMADLTAEEVYEYRTYQAYKFAAELVSCTEFGDYELIDAEIERRGWDKKKCASWGIGTVNTEEFKNQMRQAGFEPKFLDGVDLDRSNLFNNRNLIFTVYDDAGRPVGFSAKNLKYNKDGKNGPRYINTRETGLECAIFKKGERLYGYDIAKDAPSPLYIFEGQADVVTARHHGLMNCCSAMGTAVTDHHIVLLKKHGSFTITLVFDSDKGGEEGVKRIIDKKFSKEKDFRIKLCQLPEGMDPDELIRTKGFDEFVRLKRWDVFEWRIAQFIEQIDGEIGEDERRDIADKMIPIIVSEKSHIRQEEMAKKISKMTGYDVSTIISEVKRLRSEKEADIGARKINLIEALVHTVKRDPRDTEVALAQCLSDVNSINKSLQIEGEDSSTLGSIMNLKELDEAKTGEFAGFYMKPNGLGSIAARLNEDWKQDCLVYVGGGEQAAKTTMCCQMAYEIADNPLNNAICIYHSIDDVYKRIVYKWICNAAEGQNLHLNHVSSPNYWARQEGFEYITDVREKAYKKIINMIKDNKLVVKDASDGHSLSYGESLVSFYRDRYPSKNIILFIDNFHKLPDYADINGHERIKRLSNHLKNMAVMYHITIVSTVEYRKLAAGELPSNVAIAESRSLSYDSDVIIHLYNDLHNKGENLAECIHYGENGGDILPRIWCKFGKNKITGYVGLEYLDLYPELANLKPVEKNRANQEYLERKEFLSNNKGKTFGS